LQCLIAIHNDWCLVRFEAKNLEPSRWLLTESSKGMVHVSQFGSEKVVVFSNFHHSNFTFITLSSLRWSNLRQEDHHADNNVAVAVAVAVVVDLQRHCSLFFTCNTLWPMMHWLSWVDLYEYFGLAQGPNHPLSYFQPFWSRQTALKLSCPGTTVLVLKFWILFLFKIYFFIFLNYYNILMSKIDWLRLTI